jgi:hypothetical protein
VFKETNEMFAFLVIALLITSLIISKFRPKLSATIDLTVALLLLLFRVVPGTAGLFGWTLMFVFFLNSTVFFFTGKPPAAYLP